MSDRSPYEGMPLRRDMTGDELTYQLERLEIAKQPWSRRWGVKNRLRVSLWEGGQDRIPGWVPPSLLAIQTIITMKRMIESGYSPGFVSEIAASGLNHLTGRRYDEQKDPLPPDFVCPRCKTEHWNLLLDRQGWCEKCKTFTAEDIA